LEQYPNTYQSIDIVTTVLHMMVFSQVCRHQKNLSFLQRRLMAVYTLGDGWTGALGTGSLKSYAAGHYDEEDPDTPFLIHDGPVDSVSAGWGHTAFTSNGSLYVSGRAYELSNLMKLHRLPSFLRNIAIYDEDNTAMSFSSSFASRIMSMLVKGDNNLGDEMKLEKKYSVLLSPTVVELPEGEKAMRKPKSSEYDALDASACFTAIITQSGKVYTFGSNIYGQCGTGMSSLNIWSPTPLIGLSDEKDIYITQVSLGLQHGLALNSNGEIFTWGKGERGQLGIKGLAGVSAPFPQRITQFRLPPTEDGAQQWTEDVRIVEISSGINHSAARSDDNKLFVWGKNVAVSLEKEKNVQDSNFPILVRGLPDEFEIIKVSCGSHHTAVLLENGSVYAFGKTIDSRVPVFEATMILPAGVIDMPVRQFKSRFELTTIVGKDGDQVIQLNFWNDEEMRDVAAFTPTWMDRFSDPIKCVHRGMLHTVIVT